MAMAALDQCLFGGVLLLLALWWMIKSFAAFIKSRWAGEQYESRLSYSMQCGSRRIPIEAIAKALFLTAEIVAESLIVAPLMYKNMTKESILHKYPDMLQHITVFTLFALHAWLDLLTRLKFPVPPGADYLSGSLACAWFGGLINYSASNPDDLLKVAHILPVSLIYLVSLGLLIEAWCRQSFMMHMIRTYSCLVIGSFSIHSAFLLYNVKDPFSAVPNPAWDRDDPKGIQAIIAIFGMHLCLHLVTLTFGYVLSVCLLRAGGAHKQKGYQSLNSSDVEQ